MKHALKNELAGLHKEMAGYGDEISRLREELLAREVCDFAQGVNVDRGSRYDGSR